FFFKLWISKKIQYAVKLRYEKQLEEVKYSHTIKQKASLIAELIAEWLSKPEDRKHLNKLTFEAFLWLPKDIASDLSNLLSHKSESKSVREIIVSVRKYLLEEADGLDAREVIVFDRDNKEKA